MTARLQTNYLSRVSFAASQKRSERLEKQWQKLCAHYLPVAPADAVWRYHCIPSERDPTQGWKLHISASVLNAVAVLRKVAPVLAARGIPFKAPVTLTEVMKLNSGCDYGYSQVGKIITVYPRTSEEGVRIAKQLHELTRGMAAPSVPFDLKYCNRGNVYYRFGAFKPLEMKKETGVRTLAVVGPHGELEPDQRHNPKPDWVVTDPFAGDTQKKRSSRKDQNAFSSSYYVFRALSQRGKGGVYQALDLTVEPARLCLIKEGRRNGEITWDGRDGRWRIKNEERVLRALHSSGLDVPRVFASFEVKNNAYLVTEFVDGESLQSVLSKLQRRMSVGRIVEFGIQLAKLLSGMHAAGWVWRDCKPRNLIINRGKVQALDFEGACHINQPDYLFWGTPGFIPPEWYSRVKRTGLPDDLYSMGSILYLLLTGRVADVNKPERPDKFRRGIPPAMSEMIMRLLSSKPEIRPRADGVLAELRLLRKSVPPG